MTSLTPQFAPPSPERFFQTHLWLRDGEWLEWATENDIPMAPEGTEPEMIWTDIESTGLDPWTEYPLELGIALTDRWGRFIRDGVAKWLIFHNTYAWTRALDRMMPLVREMHTKSGLLAEIASMQNRPELRSSPTEVEKGAIEWLSRQFGGKTFEGKDRFPACGSSVSFDKNMMHCHMPTLCEWFNYRIGDVSSVRIFANLHYPEISGEEPKKREIHRVIPDLVDSVHLYRFYCGNFFSDVQGR